MNYLYALDISMKQTGIAIFDIDSLQPAYVGSIKTKDKDTYGKRLQHIAKELKNIVNNYPPSVVVMERGFTKFNKSTQAIYRVVGVIEFLFANYEQISYTPMTVKASILKGNASKKEVQNKIKENFDIDFKNEDESDAFSVGLCYMIKNGYIDWEK